MGAISVHLVNGIWGTLAAARAVNTFLAGCTGSFGALFTSWAKVGKPDVGMALNGALAGLVAITAPCYTVTPLGAVIIGGVNAAPGIGFPGA